MTNTPARHPIVVAVTGASGAPYAVRLLQALVAARRSVALLVSDHGWRLLGTECGIGTPDALRAAVGPDGWDTCVTLYDDHDRGALPASGSWQSDGMVICPCSMGTVSAIAHGASRSLIERAADVMLKERRPMILVPRETPLSTIHLQNLLTLSQSGVVILPAAPGFYHRPAPGEALTGEALTVDALVDFVVARILDHLHVAHDVGRRWGDARGEARGE